MEINRAFKVRLFFNQRINITQRNGYEVAMKVEISTALKPLFSQSLRAINGKHEEAQ